MSHESAIQAAIYEALNEAVSWAHPIDGTVTAGVYDQSPGLPAGLPDSDFPYIVIGDDTFQPWDADDFVGTEATINLHFWSRYKGSKEVKALMGAAYGILHRADLTVEGYETVDCLWEFAQTVRDNDNHRHGVQRYRVTICKGA